jgi:hypothetical protein
MSHDVIVLIAAVELHAPLTLRHPFEGEVLTFGDDETPRALEVILTRRPTAIVLERVFAATSRGAALLSRLKADPALSDADIRVVAHDSDYVRVVRTAAPEPGAPFTSIEVPAQAVATAAGIPAADPAPASPAPLDYRGTRRAPRHAIGGTVEVLLDGNPATLVDLSFIGAQVVSPTILRPNQRVRVALPDEVGLIRFNAIVAWASFELPKSSATPRYRAGIEFTDASRPAVDAFIARHRAGADAPA